MAVAQGHHALRAGDGASLLAANGTESALNHMIAFHRYITQKGVYLEYPFAIDARDGRAVAATADVDALTQRAARSTRRGAKA